MTKCISIKQPFASLIVEDIKDIENRTWKLPEKYKGQRVLVHASSAKAQFNFTSLQHQELNRLNLRRWYDREQVKSAIIGSVEIVDCVINHPSIWAEKTKIPYLGDVLEDIKHLGRAERPNPLTYNWVLANPIKFPEPIPAKGKLGFWEFDIENKLNNK